MELDRKGWADLKHQAVENLKRLPDRSPRELYRALDEMGYVGQEAARRSLCLSAYRHVRRLKDRHLHKVPARKLPPKPVALMIGPTGCGKTYLAELLFGQLIGVPVATVDITGFTESGYVGRNVSEILVQLMGSARENPFWAMMGVCVLDEFDKLAGSASNARFAGEGTTKDVSGYGVQRELLGLIEGGSHPAARGDRMFTGARVPMIRSDDVGFVACGAFSGIKEISVLNSGSGFGFRPAGRKTRGRGGIDYELDEQDIASVEVFHRYGFLPELIGRFSSIVRLAPLGERELKTILIRNVLPRYQEEFRREGLELKMPTKVIARMVHDALERRTGARGLTLQLTRYLEDRAFEQFGCDGRRQAERLA